MKRLSSAAILIALSMVLVSLACSTETVKEIPVEKIVTQEVVKEIPVERVVEVEKEVIRTVEVEKPVEVIREVVKEVKVPGETVVVEVEKEVVRIVEVEKPVEVVRTVEVDRPVIRTQLVVATPTAMAMMSKEGTIPGSKVVVSLETIGQLTKEPRSQIALYGCRPGCLVIKDDFLLVDSTYTLHPHVIKSWEFSADTTSWTIDMQDGIKFWDGRDATIDDLMWSIFDGFYAMDTAPLTGEKLDGRPLRWGVSIPWIDAVSREIVDDDTIAVQFPGPTIGLAVNSLTTRVDSGGLRDSKTIIEKGWKHFLENPNFTAAYMPTKEVAQEIKEYEAWPDHWKWQPDFEVLHLLEVPESATRVAQLAAKQADIAAISAVTLPQALKLDHVGIIEQKNISMTQHFFVNVFRPEDPGYNPDWPFNDIRVREAFNIAINRDLIIDRIYNGRVLRQDAPLLGPGTLGWNEPEVQAMINDPIPYDPARARQLLAAANFPMDMKLKIVQGNIVFGGVPEMKELNTAILTQWRQNLGLDVELVLGDRVQIFGPHRNDKQAIPYEIYGGEQHGVDPLGAKPENFYKDNGWNFFLPAKDELLALYTAKQDSLNPAEVSRLSAQISKLVRDQWMFVPITVNPLFFGKNRETVKDWPLAPVKWPQYFEQITAVR